MQFKQPSFSRNVWLTGALFVILAITFAIYVWSEKQIDRANDLRHEAFLLANELRQSSDDLTRMVRTYVTIGDPLYKQIYQDILDIRDGRMPRPQAYQRIYWDFVLANKQPPRPGSGQTVSLLDLMRRGGFTESEFRKLAEAKANSDALTVVEFEAMRLVETTGPEAEANRTKARLLVFDDRYLKAKAAIMKPLDELYVQMDKRTNDSVQTAKTNATIFRLLFLLLGLSLVLLLSRINNSLRTTLGGSVDEVYAHIGRIGSGDLSAAIVVAGGHKNSVLGWLGETQIKLRNIEQERKLAEEALRRSQQRQDLALAGADLGLWDWDVSGGKALFDTRWCSMLGYRVEELEPSVNTWLVLMHPEDRTVVQAILERYLKNEAPAYEAEFRMRHKAGHWVWILVRGKVMERNGAGAPLRMVGTHMDITGRKLTEEKFRLANLLSDQALDLTKAGYWHVPLDGSGWYNSSERAATIFGDIPRAGWRYRVMEEWFSNVEAGDKTAAERTLENYNAAVAGRIPKYDAIYAYKRPVDGRIVWIHAMAHVVKDASGKATDLYGVTQDITESKLAQDAIRQAKEAAETASHAKSDFLATMSHEIRTPMNGVLGFTDLLLNTSLDDKQRKYAKIIRNSGEGLLTIINDILDFSKIEAGKITLEPRPCDPAEVIHEVIGLMEARAQEKTIRLSVDYPPDLPLHIVADSNRVRQVTLNLVGNALKFTERGSVTVRASDLASAGQRFLRIEIIDTGIGIPKDKQSQLFQKFVQADVSTTRRFGGTGLGLAISKRLVEAMGGQVGFESEPGLGSTFWFTFPLVEAPASLRADGNRPPTNAPFPLLGATPAGSGLLNLRVLVAEDGDTNQIYVTTLLESFGCQADLAVDGRVAVQLFRTRPYDLVLMDCRMPEMDGFEATVEIRKYERLKASPVRVPIIALTASVMQDEQERCLQVGMDECLSKPFRALDLKEILNRWASTSADSGNG